MSDSLINELLTGVNSQDAEIRSLKSKLAACEVQRDALRGACRKTKEWIVQEDPDCLTEDCQEILDCVKAALDLSPERAASVNEDLDRYKAALEQIKNTKPANSTPAMWFAAYEACVGVANQALVTKGDSE
jgi:hypothetical protein